MPGVPQLLRTRMLALTVLGVAAWGWMSQSTSASRVETGPWSYGFPGQSQSYSATLLLLDYSDGFRRRALPGAVLRWFQPADAVSLATGWWVWFGCVLAAVCAVAALVYRTLGTNPRAGWCLVAFAVSPFGFGSIAADGYVAACTVALLAVLGLLYRSGPAGLVATAAMVPVAGLVHEQMLVFAVPVLWCMTHTMRRVHRVLLLAPSVVGTVVLLVWARTTGSAALIARGTFPVETWVGTWNDYYDSVAATLDANRAWFTAVGFAAPVAGVLLAVWFAAVVLLYTPLPRPHRTSAWLLVAAVVATGVVAVDWPRFAALALTACCVIAASAPPVPLTRRRARAGAAAAVLLGIVVVVGVWHVDPAFGPFPLAWWLGADPKFAVSL